MNWLPISVGRVEAWLSRTLLVMLVLWSVRDVIPYDRMEDPVGIGRLGLDLSWLGRSGVHPWFLAGIVLAGLIYILGIGRRSLVTLIGLAGLTVGHVACWTLRNSQGNTFHGSQMTSLVLMLQLLGASVVWHRERQRRPPSRRWPGMDGVLLYMSQSAIAAVYVTCALTKIAKSRGSWLLDSHYLAKSVQKVWRQLYYDNPSLTEFCGISPWAEWLASHPLTARLIFAPGFLLELLAFVILVNRRVALWFGLGLFVMHLGIGFIMQLQFPEFEALVLLFCVNIPWLVAISFSHFSRSK